MTATTKRKRPKQLLLFPKCVGGKWSPRWECLEPDTYLDCRRPEWWPYEHVGWIRFIYLSNGSDRRRAWVFVSRRRCPDVVAVFEARERLRERDREVVLDLERSLLLKEA